MGLFDDTPKPALNWAVDTKLVDTSKPAPIWKDDNATPAKTTPSPKYEIETSIKPPEVKKTNPPIAETQSHIPPAIRSWPIPTADFKPGVDMAIAVFRNYLRVTSPGEMRRSLGTSGVIADRYQALAERHKEQLRKDLEGLGLAKYINFDE